MAPAHASDSEQQEPMEAEHFDLAVAEVSFRNPKMLKAVRACMVDGMRTADAADAFGIPHANHLSRAITKVEAKWAAICKRNNWVCKPVVLDASDFALVESLQRRTIENVNLKKAKKPRRRP